MTTLREKLLGAWKLESFMLEPVDASPPYYPFGTEPEGLILYTADGFMSAQLARRGRTPFASGDWFDGTPEEYEEEATGYIAYSGPFHVDEAIQELTHTMSVSLFPNWEGQTQVRLVQFQNDRLHLSTENPIVSGGKLVHAYLVWKRPY